MARLKLAPRHLECSNSETFFQIPSKNFYFSCLKEKSVFSIPSGGHNFVTGRHCYWQKLDKNYEIKYLFAFKFKGTKTHLHLIFILPVCLYLYLWKTFGPLLSPQNFHGVTCDSAVRFFLENIIKITWLWRSAPTPLKVTPLPACHFQVEQP